jgi:putative FmdB family regulatory protein
MPVYEYECSNCEKVTELERRHIERHDEATCAHCGAKTTTLILSRTSFILEGGGWYQTDYKGKGRK